MKEKIQQFIDICNSYILKWYELEFPSELMMGEFTPVDVNNEEVIDTIYQMYLTLINQSKIKNHLRLLSAIVKYYFTIAVVEYYGTLCPLFYGVENEKHMVEFSNNPQLSSFRRKMMGFSEEPYKAVKVSSPCKFNIPIKTN